MADNHNHGQSIIACIWDFDKTLIPGYMQAPLFEEYGIDGRRFWHEVNQLPAIYRQRGVQVSGETVYLNHLLSYVKNGPLKGLSNQKLRALGQRLAFNPGIPDLFKRLKQLLREREVFQRHDLKLEHYVVSTGLAEMIRGSEIAPYVDGIFGCEFIEEPLPPGFLDQDELPIECEREISQIGVMVDNTIKTRFVFEINKGSNLNREIDVNARVAPEDRRIPLENMIYVADGPSDVPVFSVVKSGGGLAFAVYDPQSEAEFAQNDRLLRDGRIHSYGPTDFREGSSSSMWLRMHILGIAERVVTFREMALKRRVGEAPRHIHPPSPVSIVSKENLQADLL
ncbi:MAG: HAD family hydrolase [Puniceicoccaceae bacterium]